jgi:hypothetical protein
MDSISPILFAFETSKALTAGAMTLSGPGSHSPGKGLKLNFRSRLPGYSGDLPRSAAKLSIDETL